MNPGDIVQIQRSFRLFEREMSGKDPRKAQEIVSIMVFPDEIYLLTKLLHHKEKYPKYNYATIELLVSGKTWMTTMTLNDEYEVEKYIKTFDFKKVSKAQSQC